MHIRSGPGVILRQVMVFVDGGYIREYLKDKYGNDEFIPAEFGNFVWYVVTQINWTGPISSELVRTYYYDAIADETEDEVREKQKLFFGSISKIPFCEVRLGHLVKTEKGRRQKGVDVLMAIDMLTKAYENHYEAAVLVGGDADLVELVKAVKDAGKRVCGAYIPDHVSEDFKESLDFRIELTETRLAHLLGLPK